MPHANPVDAAPCVRRVRSFEEWRTASFAGNQNAVCWQRDLDGDFDEVAQALVDPSGASDAVTAVAPDRLLSLDLTPAGESAAATIVRDLDRLRELGHDPELSHVMGYPIDPDDILPTHVYSFHVDSADAPTETLLCSYTAPASEGLCPRQAQRAVDVPAIRAQLLAQYGGADDAAFHAYLHELHYDLHFVPFPNVTPFPFGVGHLWRLAVEHPASPVHACIHRAPTPAEGAGPRLLLIS